MTIRKKNKIDDFEEDLKNIDPKVIDLIKNQIREELTKDDDQLKEELKKEKIAEKRVKTQYLNKMMKSNVPWFDLTATSTEDEESVLQYELEWNTSFQRFLIQNKIAGTNDLERTEHWLIEMLHNIIEIKESKKLDKNESEFQ